MYVRQEGGIHVIANDEKGGHLRAKHHDARHHRQIGDKGYVLLFVRSKNLS